MSIDLNILKMDFGINSIKNPVLGTNMPHLLKIYWLAFFDSFNEGRWAQHSHLVDFKSYQGIVVHQWNNGYNGVDEENQFLKNFYKVYQNVYDHRAISFEKCKEEWLGWPRQAREHFKSQNYTALLKFAGNDDKWNEYKIKYMVLVEYFKSNSLDSKIPTIPNPDDDPDAIDKEIKQAMKYLNIDNAHSGNNLADLKQINNVLKELSEIPTFQSFLFSN